MGSSLNKGNRSIELYFLSVLSFKNMSLRQLVKEAKKGLSKALFYFPQEMKTGIAPTRLILNSDKIIPLKEGTSVTVNWGGKKVQAEILALDGKESFICSYTNSLLNNLERISYFYTTLVAPDNNFFYDLGCR